MKAVTIPPSKRGCTFTLAYGPIEKAVSGHSKLTHILIGHSVRGKESTFSVCACDSNWHVWEMRGQMPSAEYAVIFAIETYDIKVHDLTVYSGNEGQPVFSKPRTSEDRIHAKARKRIHSLLSEFKYFPRFEEKCRIERKQNRVAVRAAYLEKMAKKNS